MGSFRGTFFQEEGTFLIKAHQPVKVDLDIRFSPLIEKNLFVDTVEGEVLA